MCFNPVQCIDDNLSVTRQNYCSYTFVTDIACMHYHKYLGVTVARSDGFCKCTLLTFQLQN